MTRCTAPRILAQAFNLSVQDFDQLPHATETNHNSNHNQNMPQIPQMSAIPNVDSNGK
eukprot:CAMPEP_0197059680 /NCGR_PEP_ID=MMETSP1384-20130603/119904_1 /TAXON_ID=29189 /ORGANISM="Ammonia sp." /LENGTH=57 /DNA_ID=CAMNT_0042494797 /DNA_START=52 /DNA_END=222 /DNA_ORIENTATION=+